MSKEENTNLGNKGTLTQIMTKFYENFDPNAIHLSVPDSGLSLRLKGIRRWEKDNPDSLLLKLLKSNPHSHVGKYGTRVDAHLLHYILEQHNAYYLSSKEVVTNTFNYLDIIQSLLKKQSILRKQNTKENVAKEYGHQFFLSSVYHTIQIFCNPNNLSNISKYYDDIEFKIWYSSKFPDNAGFFETENYYYDNTRNDLFIQDLVKFWKKNRNSLMRVDEDNFVKADIKNSYFLYLEKSYTKFIKLYFLNEDALKVFEELNNDYLHYNYLNNIDEVFKRNISVFQKLYKINEEKLWGLPMPIINSLL